MDRLKSVVRKFAKILKTQHPDYRFKMEPILKRPLPGPPKLNYFSFHTGTIIKQKFKKFPRPRAWSLIDLRPFANDKPRNLDDNDWAEPEASLEDLNTLNAEGALPLRKSNSSHTLSILGKKAELRRPISFPSDSNGVQRKAKKRAGEAKKNRWGTFDDSSDSSDASFNDQEEEEEDTDEEVEAQLHDEVCSFFLQPIHDRVSCSIEARGFERRY